MVLIQEVSVRDRDWSNILTIMPGAASFVGTLLLVELVHPPLSWRFPVSLVLYTILLIVPLLPLVTLRYDIVVLAAGLMSLLFGILAALALFDLARWWIYAVGGLLYFVQALVAVSFLARRHRRLAAVQPPEQAYAQPDE
jgi:type IV secretory pathway TrbD component